MSIQSRSAAVIKNTRRIYCLKTASVKVCRGKCRASATCNANIAKHTIALALSRVLMGSCEYRNISLARVLNSSFGDINSSFKSVAVIAFPLPIAAVRVVLWLFIFHGIK